MLLRIRAIFNETGTTSGFLDNDANLLKYIDSGQNEVADRLLSVQTKMKVIKPFFEYDSLKVLITLHNFPLETGVYEYRFSDLTITDYKLQYDLQIEDKGATFLPIAELEWRKQNSFLSANVYNPYYTINSSSSIEISPVPTIYENGYEVNFRYYKKPFSLTDNVITGPIVSELTLLPETHEAIMYYALSLAYEQDKETNLSTKYLTKFEKQLAELT